MKQMTVKQLRSMKVGEIVENLPFILRGSRDYGEVKPIAIVGKPDEVIVVSDLHPVMRERLLNIERLARSTMPEPEKVEDVF